MRSGRSTHHIYLEPFRRDDHLVRLLPRPRAATSRRCWALAPRAPAAGDHPVQGAVGDQGAQSDVLKVNGIDVINAATSPLDNRTNAVFVLDAGADGSRPGAPLSPFYGLST